MEFGKDVNKVEIAVVALVVLGVVAVVVGFPGQEPETSSESELDTVETWVPEGSVSLIPYLIAADQNIFEKHGIDLKVHITPYMEYNTALSDRRANISHIDFTGYLGARKEGHDLVMVGPSLISQNHVLVRNSSAYEDIQDLKGEKLSTPFDGTTATSNFKAMIYRRHNLNLTKDFDVVATDPAASWGSVKNGKVEGGLQFTGYTLKGMTDPEVRSVWDPVEFWKEETGHPPLVAFTAAHRDFLQKNPDVARRYLAAYKESVEYFRNHPEEGLDRYGTLADLTSEEKEVVKDLMKDELIFRSRASGDFWDAQWEILQAYQDVGLVDEVPSQEDVLITYSEIEGMEDEEAGE